MGVRTDDLFGAAPPAEPATPGSYGEPPRGRRLPEATRLGPVRLAVADLARSTDWYQQVLGLRIVERAGATARLAPQHSDRWLVELNELPGARPAPGRGRLGLFHFAILVPDRPSLGRFVRHLRRIGAPAGAGDHLVSEAIYLRDPDSLGIEVYADRPREAWRRVGRELMMATDPVDLDNLLEAAGSETWSGMPAGTTMGHVHLHVGDIPRADEFYAETIGFDRTVRRYPGALFLSAGGYHHHLGANTWAGPDAQRAAADEARLLEWTIELPEAADVDAVAESLTKAKAPARRDGADLITSDPWGTTARIRTA